MPYSKRLRIVLQSKPFIILSLIFIVCYIILFTKVIKYSSKYSDETIIYGIVTDYTIDGDKLSLLIKGKEDIPASYYFKSESEKLSISNNMKLGLKLKLEGELKEPSNNTIPNTFNYKKYLYNKKMYKTFTISKIDIEGFSNNIFYKIKNYFINKSNSFLKTSSYMHAFILGDKGYIDSDTYQAYQVNGVTHLFAVSGMHVGFLVMAIVSILSKLKIKENKQNIIIGLFLIFYMFLIGFSASVVRASLLYILLLVNKKFNINLKTITVLYILFIGLIIINPFYIYDLGFIYSFLTSFGLILFNKKIKGNYLAKTFYVSLIAFIFSLPVTLYNFYQFNLLTILNNIIIVPIVSLVLFPLTLITFIFPFLEDILEIGFKILEVINMYSSRFSINIVIPKINVIFIIIYYIVIYLIYKYGFRYVIGLIFLILVFKYSPYLDNHEHIYYLDVGQGDATLIVSKRRKDIILIDTGGKIEFNKEEWQKRNSSFSLASNIVSFLNSLGIDYLDLLVITHGDQDHIGYAEEIVDKVKVKKLMFNNNELNFKEKNLALKIPRRVKDVFKGENVSLYNLNTFVESDENTSSLVLYILLKECKLLVMGDAPKVVEKDILSKYDLEVDILKLGHHGSNTSSDYDFLKEINPKYSIISSGRNNRYNHPSKETIDSLDDLGLIYFNTQDKGTIEYDFGSKDNIRFYKP